jgi:hypothetical protein
MGCGGSLHERKFGNKVTERMMLNDDKGHNILRTKKRGYYCSNAIPSPAMKNQYKQPQ